MSASSTEKSPVDRDDFEGLQVDTRAKDTIEKHLDPLSTPQDMCDHDDSENEDDYLSEKQAAADVPQTSPKWSSSTAGLDKATPVQVRILTDDSAGSPQAPKIRRICGVRRRKFWFVFGVILATVLAAAIVGGAIGGTRHFSSSVSQDRHATGTNSTGENPLYHANVIVGSPLSVISYSETTGEQTLRMYFQSVRGNIKETSRTGTGPWLDARPIFTDAIENTGLAAITYSVWNASTNHSQQQGSIFYVGSSTGYLREKRKIFGSVEIWDAAGLSKIDDPYTIGNNTTFDWDSYRMAAVYSEHFASGPGCRLFYHTGDSTGNWVQELIWYRKNDTWTPGNRIYDALPNSHLSATVDDSTKTLSLFYINVINNTKHLQYSWTNITDDKGYQKGFLQENIADRGAVSQNGTSVDIAAVSDSGNNYIYYYSNSTDNLSAVREIRISGPDGQGFKTARVSYPKNNTSPYQPLTAVKFGDGWNVFWADDTTGSTDFSRAWPNNHTGYSRLWEVSRTVNSTWSNANNTMSVSLGQEDDDPHLTPKIG